MNKALLEIFIDSIQIPKHKNFLEFLEAGFPLNEEDRLRHYTIEASPWHREIAKWVDDPDTDWIYLIQGSQTAKTVFMMGFLMHKAQGDPCRILLVQSTEDEARIFIKDRLRPYIDNYDPTAINSKTWKTEAFKVFKARVKVGYGTSEASLRSIPCAYVIGDEFSIWELPVILLKKRTRTFAGGKRKGIFGTTPPRSKKHHSWKEILNTSVYCWFVPCPDCGEFQRLEMKGLKWKGKEGDLWDYEQVQKTTRYQCIACKSLWNEDQKLQIIQKGKMVCVDPENQFTPCDPRANDSKTFQISSLYSVFTKWSELAVLFLKAKNGSREDLEYFITDELAEVPEEIQKDGESLEIKLLKKFIDPSRSRGFKEGFDLYTGGADIQRLGEAYWSIIGWRAGSVISAHLLDFGIVPWLDTYGKPKPEDLLEAIAPYQNFIYRFFVDATDGVMEQDIFDLVAFLGQPFIALKDSGAQKIKLKFSTLIPREKQRFNQQIVTINSALVKNEISTAFSRAPGLDSSCTLPDGVTEEYLYSMTTEQRVLNLKTGRYDWEKKRHHAPNHYFSSFVYAYAAMEDCRHLLQKTIEKKQEEPQEPQKNLGSILNATNLFNRRKHFMKL